MKSRGFNEYKHMNEKRSHQSPHLSGDTSLDKRMITVNIEGGPQRGLKIGIGCAFNYMVTVAWKPDAVKDKGSTPYCVAANCS